MNIRNRLAAFLKKLAMRLEAKESLEERPKKEQFVFKPAQRYEMYVIGRPRVMYKGRIEDVKEDKLVLSAPVERSVPVFLPKGTKVLLAIVGLPSGRYEFETRVDGFVEEDNSIPELILEKPRVIYRKQRRAKPRTRIYTKVSYRIVENSLAQKIKMPLKGKVDAWDMSALGLGLLFPEELPLHARMRVSFVIPDTGILVKAVCEVVNKRWDDFSRKYITGLLFVDISEEDRAHIDKRVSLYQSRHVDGFIS